MRIQAVTYLNWLSKEFRFSGNTKDIYNSIAYNDYEYAINYEDRVRIFKKGLIHLDRPYRKVLDIACGTGAFIEAINRKENTKVLGIDISKKMLDVAKKRFEEHPNVSFKNLNFLNANFPPKSFDLISITYATRFIPEESEQDFIKKIFGWLSDNGIFIVVLSEKKFFYNILYFIWKVFKIPKGFNLPMNFSKYFIQTVDKYFKLDNNIYLSKKYIFIESKMLFFKKV